MDENADLYRSMFAIRCFEERLLTEFSSGKLTGTTHTYIGQEADAAGIFSVTGPDDLVFSNHRCHGHFLAYGGDPYRLAAELMGKVTGLVGGRGGSQHIQWGNFYTNGIQGGMIPVACGMALAEKTKRSGNVTLVFIGDGTLGEGVLYESLNIASLWGLPVLVIVEDNRIAQSTPSQLGVAGSMAGRFDAFGIRVWERETNDVLEIRDAAKESLTVVRNDTKPGCLLLHTTRFSAHSKSDDTRSADELARLREMDPLNIHGRRLTGQDRAQIEGDVRKLIDDAFRRAESDPLPVLDPASRNV